MRRVAVSEPEEVVKPETVISTVQIGPQQGLQQLPCRKGTVDISAKYSETSSTMFLLH